MGGALIGAAGVGAGGSLIDTGLGFLSAKIGYKRMKKMYKHRYQWAAQDLEAAGLNRILALTRGPGVATQVPIGGQSRIGEGARGAMLVAAQLDQIRASTAKTVTEDKLLRAGVPTAEVKEDVMQWLFERARSLFGEEGRNSAKDLLSPEAKKAFGVQQKSARPPIRIVPQGQKYKGEK